MINDSTLLMDTPYDWRKSIAAGLLTGVLAVLLTHLYFYTAGPSLTIPEAGLTMSFLTSYYVMMLWFGGILTFGLPVTLYLRFNLKSPLIWMLIVPAFWFILANTGSQGDSPWQAFLYAFFPIYVGIYLLFGAAERYLRENTSLLGDIL